MKKKIYIIWHYGDGRNDSPSEGVFQDMNIFLFPNRNKMGEGRKERR
jgi:hypothetical protein